MNRRDCTLKDYRRKDLSLYLLAIFSILFINSVEWIKITENNWQQILVKNSYSAMSFGIAYILVFISTSLIPSDSKLKLLFCGSKRIPGNIVITRLISKKWTDIRLSKDSTSEILSKKFGLEKGNAQWYSMYSCVQDEPSVLGSNKDFLFARDLSILTIETFVGYLVIVWPLKVVRFNINSFFILLVLIALTVSIVRILGKRFVLNVVVRYLKSEEVKNEHY